MRSSKFGHSEPELETSKLPGPANVRGRNEVDHHQQQPGHPQPHIPLAPQSGLHHDGHRTTLLQKRS